MRHGSISLLFFLACCSGFAQSWCPPGATWTYTYSDGWTIEGFARFTYVGDTVIAALPSQILSVHNEGLQFGTPFSVDAGSCFTTVDGDLVSIWTGTGFDTLYHFGAAPGDHWQMPSEDGLPSMSSVVVSDTGTTVIDGVPLRYLVAGNDTIKERLGSRLIFMLPWVTWMIDAPGGPLRCYEDEQMTYSAPWWAYGCASYMQQTEINERPDVLLFPNPGSDHFALDLPEGSHMITVHDALGRTMLRQRTSSGTATINTQAFPAGLYSVRAERADGKMLRTHWVKN